MSKHLRIWLFVILGTLLATTSLLAQGVITMTTSRAVGEEIGLSIKANGNVAIEGAQETSDYDTYTLTSQTVTIRGDVTELDCRESQLTSLDVSKNIALTKLLCSNNKLTSLNVSGCTRLTFIACTSNYIKGKAMTKLVNSLPNRREKSSGTLLVVDCSSQKRDRNRCSAADVTTAKRKNWEVLKDRGPYDWVSYSGD